MAGTSRPPGTGPAGAPPARLTVVSGPSGVGKSSVVAEVLSMCPQVWLSVSATTRTPRAGEVEGTHYYFIDRAEFMRRARAGELLEWAEFAGNLYGTPRLPVQERLAAGTPVLLEIELEGARQVRASMPEATLVFIAPPSWDVLVERLTGRGTEDPARVARRLDAARRELAAEGEFDRSIVNESIRECAGDLVACMGIDCSP